MSTTQRVSTNIRLLMNNSTPRVSQQTISDVIGLEQPQVSKRMRGLQDWRIGELEAIAKFFDVPFTLLVEPETSAVYRYLAEHGVIDLTDQDGPMNTCTYGTRSDDPELPLVWANPSPGGVNFVSSQEREQEFSTDRPSYLLAAGL